MYCYLQRGYSLEILFTKPRVVNLYSNKQKTKPNLGLNPCSEVGKRGLKGSLDQVVRCTEKFPTVFSGRFVCLRMKVQALHYSGEMS